MTLIIPIVVRNLERLVSSVNQIRHRCLFLPRSCRKFFNMSNPVYGSAAANDPSFPLASRSELGKVHCATLRAWSKRYTQNGNALGRGQRGGPTHAGGVGLSSGYNSVMISPHPSMPPASFH